MLLRDKSGCLKTVIIPEKTQRFIRKLTSTVSCSKHFASEHLDDDVKSATIPKKKNKDSAICYLTSDLSDELFRRTFVGTSWGEMSHVTGVTSLPECLDRQVNFLVNLVISPRRPEPAEFVS